MRWSECCIIYLVLYGTLQHKPQRFQLYRPMCMTSRSLKPQHQHQTYDQPIQWEGFEVESTWHPRTSHLWELWLMKESWTSYNCVLLNWSPHVHLGGSVGSVLVFFVRFNYLNGDEQVVKSCDSCSITFFLHKPITTFNNIEMLCQNC